MGDMRMGSAQSGMGVLDMLIKMLDQQSSMLKMPMGQ